MQIVILFQIPEFIVLKVSEKHFSHNHQQCRISQATPKMKNQGMISCALLKIVLWQNNCKWYRNAL